jgi:DNA modification methylase
MEAPMSIIPLADAIPRRTFHERILWGDSLALYAHLAGQVDLVVTSPPYYKVVNADAYLAPYANMAEYHDFLDAHIAGMATALREDGFVAFNIGLYVQFDHIEHLPALAMGLFARHGLRLVNEIIWHKPKGTQGLWTMPMTRWLKGKTDQPILAKQHEYLHIYAKPGRKPLPRHDEAFIKEVAWSVWSLPVSPYRGHPCAFPLALAERAIRLYSNPGDLVLDPFAGAFTTALAARAAGRRWVGCELSEAYCRAAEARLNAG